MDKEVGSEETSRGINIPRESQLGEVLIRSVFDLKITDGNGVISVGGGKKFIVVVDRSLVFQSNLNRKRDRVWRKGLKFTVD